MNPGPATPQDENPPVGSAGPGEGDGLSRRLALVIAAIGALIYLNSVPNGYALDDFSAIRDNHIVRQGLPALPEIFTTSYRAGYLSLDDGLYRPLSLALFAVEWHFFPDQPAVSHLVNVVLYSLTGWWLLRLLWRLRAGAGRPDALIVAFIASLLFITHPLHVEVVANIKSRDEILCLLLVLLSLWHLLDHVAVPRGRALLRSCGALFLAFLSKENAIAFLGVAPLALVFFRGLALHRVLPVMLPLAGTIALGLALRAAVLGTLAPAQVWIADNLLAGADTWATRTATAFHILGLYILKLGFPHPLSYDYSFNHIPLTGFGSPSALASLLGHTAALTFAGVILWRRLRPGRGGPATPVCEDWSFGLLYYLGTLFPLSNLAFLIGTSMGERLLYLPSVGACLCVALTSRAALRLDDRALLSPGAALPRRLLVPRLIPVWIVTGLFSATTIARNPDWRDNLTLFATDLETVPGSAKAHYYLGAELVSTVAPREVDPLRRTELLRRAIHHLGRATEILPGFGAAHTQLGAAHQGLGDLAQAIACYQRARSLNPRDLLALTNLGTAYFGQRRYDEAQALFREVLAVDARSVNAHLNLGNVLAVQGDYPGAIASFRNALRHAPDDARAHHFLGLAYQKSGDPANAEQAFARARALQHSAGIPVP